MHVQTLAQVPFDTLLNCFLKAFENYFVKMPTDPEYYRQRWTAAKVDYASSYGVFDDQQLVGFIIHAVDVREGQLTAYNTGTGIIPAYRGQGLVQKMYAFAFPDLIQKGFTRSTLEVIQQNQVAIAVYQKVGFEIYKSYQCFGGTLTTDNDFSVTLEEVSLEKVDWRQYPNQEYYSWDNHHRSILGGDYHFFKVHHLAEAESYFVINAKRNYIAQFEVLSEDQHAWSRLFAGIQQLTPRFRINNVDARLSQKLEYLSRFGLSNTIDQFEMEIALK